jgi:hypothetical protein
MAAAIFSTEALYSANQQRFHGFDKAFDIGWKIMRCSLACSPGFKLVYDTFPAIFFQPNICELLPYA